MPSFIANVSLNSRNTYDLGDLSVQSWVQSDEDNSDSTMRMANMDILGLSAKMYNFENNDVDKPAIFSHIDVDVNVQKRDSQLALQTKVSAVEVILRYSDYIGLLAVLNDNFGKKIEKRIWDNLEVAWEEEVLRDNASNVSNISYEHESPRYSKEVSYSDNARRIRYGQSSASGGSDKDSLDLLFDLSCENMSLLLHRNDDLVTKDKSGSGYGIVLLAIRQLIASMKREDGLENSSVSLSEVFMFDIGESARAIQRGQDSKALPHSVLIEGYSTPNDRDHFDSQVVITMDRNSSSPDDVNVSILVNYLSVAALLRPLEEVLAFFSCTWTVSSQLLSSNVKAGLLDDDQSEGSLLDIPKSRENASNTPGKRLKLKFVLHYARFIFAVDERDCHSRALVLEG